ncbi:type II secretion system protein [Paludicola sp. MB14-C6]|uniref:type IV pilus modification PilV family protein n=1 Tax=Paludihabitans sp. MB14-C6 TaxID=3070656 RepID=UPI0027DDCEF7|nr:type II secretion system protein [Paludicola sp. MB14-C6]WMJ22100.1 type II secretion system protein [Paludicola sp. MB14-C6]
MKLLYSAQNNKGETLIEVVVSLAILSILMVTLISLMMSALSINQKACKTTLEDGINKKGIELKTYSETPEVDYQEGDANNKIEVKFMDASLNFSKNGHVLVGEPKGEKMSLKQFNLLEQMSSP